MKVLPILIAILGLWVCGVNAQLTPSQHAALVDKARQISKLHIDYNEGWKPPGESKSWAMDCSNTSRYLYKSVFGIEIPRTASDQYFLLKKAHSIVYAPRFPNGTVDSQALFNQLRSGDLLFWQWTYDIDRDPPITHVMIYLGRTADGTPKMVGSSSRSPGETTNGGGVSVYVFDPNANMGGVRNFFGNYICKGQFVGFGRIIKRNPASGTQTAAITQ